MSISDFRKKKLLFLFNVFFGEYLSEWWMAKDCSTTDRTNCPIPGELPGLWLKNFD